MKILTLTPKVCSLLHQSGNLLETSIADALSHAGTAMMNPRVDKQQQQYGGERIQLALGS